jgi:hypothetical protein
MSKTDAPKFGKKYTDAEIALVLAYGNKHTLKTLARFLGRNVGAIDMILRWGGNYSDRELLESSHKDNAFVRDIRRVRKELGMR